MPRHLAFRAVLAVALLAFAAGCLAAAAQAQDTAPSAAQRTLISAGTGQAKVTPTDTKNNAAIVKAIDAAEARALPLAIANAKSEAQALATAAGVTLGPLVTVSNAANSPFYGPFYAFGSFGPNKFCGKARVFHFQKGKDGKRHRTFETKFVCRYPHQIQRQVQLTYALG
jgi:uncharacterized protein YggE